MSLKRVLLASGAAIALLAPATDASAQYRYYDQSRLDRHKYDRQANVVRLTRAPNVDAGRPPMMATKKPTVSAGKPAPVAPLSAEQIAAKAAIDELMAREPALAAAKEKPDPKLAKAAAAKHDEQERQLAALKAKQDAEAAKRKEIAAKIKARDEAKAVALKAKQDAQAQNAGSKADARRTDLARNKPHSKTAAASVAAPPPEPVRRMPTP